MRPSEIEQLLPHMIRANINVHLEGPPGVGKTQIAEAAARDIGAETVFFHAPSRQPEDMAVPKMDVEELMFKINRDLPVYGSKWDPDVNPDAPDRVVVIVDELSQADHGIQKMFGNLMQAKEHYGWRLLPWVSFISTGNCQEHRAGASKMLTHLADRLTFLTVDFNLDDFDTWTLRNGVHPLVRSFAKVDGKHINDFKPDRQVNPSARSWVEGVSPLLDMGLPVHLLYEAIKGRVGEGAATVFQSFIKMASHLNIDALMADPKGYPMPTESSVLYVLATTLAMKSTVKNFDTIMTIANRMPKEFSVVLVLEASKTDPRIMSTTAYQQWAVGPGAAVLGIR